MGAIKSALELALERTETVASDRGSLENYAAKQDGLRLANRFLTGECDNLEKEIKAAPEKTRDALKDGLLDGLLVRLALPYTNEEVKPLEKIGAALAVVVTDKRFPALYRSFVQQIAQFPEEYKQYDKAIRQQYAPTLRQKEEQLSAQLGYPVKIDPMQDPEFAKFYNQNMTNLKTNYEELISQIKTLARGEEPEA